MADVYDWLALELAGAECRFLNYGHIGPEGRTPGVDGLHVALLERVLVGVSLAGKRVLEVGSGRGGNCTWMQLHRQPALTVGVDLCLPNLVAATDQPKLLFSAADAHELPFADAVFDIVLNLESSHCYENLGRCVHEIARVLKPGGIFCWADLWGVEGLSLDWNSRGQAFQIPQLEVISEEDLSEGVFLALKDPSSLPNRLLQACTTHNREVIEPIANNIRTFRLHLAAGQGDYRMKQLRKVQAQSND